MEENKFNSKMDVKIAFGEFLVYRNTNSFEKGIILVVTRWQNCMESDGTYFD